MPGQSLKRSNYYIPVFRHRKQQRRRQWPWRRRAGDIRNRPRPREVPVRKGWRWIESRWAGQRQSCFFWRVRWLFPLRHFPESPLLPLQSLITHPPLYSRGRLDIIRWPVHQYIKGGFGLITVNSPGSKGGLQKALGK